MTPLHDLLVRRITTGGPITIADYMAECLLHPEHGYYSTRDPFGAGGDFITAPEISQMFGELLGLALAQCWLDQGQPETFTLAELGPGRATLMADILRATQKVPGFHDAANVVLVEASDHLRKVQRQTLSPHPATWVDSAADLPDAPLFLVANEFFDALPIRQFTRDGQGWREDLVTTDGHALSLKLGAPLPIGALDHRLGDTTQGDIVELCPMAGGITGALTSRIKAKGGAAIVIDYGNWRSLGDTLQAVKDHKPQDPFANPGDADLTAHVDFGELAQAGRDVAVTPMTPQGVFLERLGITARAQQLAGPLTGDALQNHIAAHRRLTHPDEMGSLFKAIAFHPRGRPAPPGFDQ